MKFIDFFAGVGGFNLGMTLAGNECVGHCEIDKYADASYRMMHTVTEEQREYLLSLPKGKRLEEIRKDEYLNGHWYSDDITRVRPDELPEADIYCGGFPCQAFSIAGKRRGFDDTRGTLFFEIMRLAKVRRPDYLFLENVKGLLSHDDGQTLGVIISTLEECGYDAQWQVLNTKDVYTDMPWFRGRIPQNRERIFIIANLRGKRRPEVFPLTRTDCEDPADVNRGGTLFCDFRYDCGIRIRKEQVSPCLTRAMRRGESLSCTPMIIEEDV